MLNLLANCQAVVEILPHVVFWLALSSDKQLQILFINVTSCCWIYATSLGSISKSIAEIWPHFLFGNLAIKFVCGLWMKRPTYHKSEKQVLFGLVLRCCDPNFIMIGRRRYSCFISSYMYLVFVFFCLVCGFL